MAYAERTEAVMAQLTATFYRLDSTILERSYRHLAEQSEEVRDGLTRDDYLAMAESVVNRAGSIAMYPNITPNVYFNAPLAALPARIESDPHIDSLCRFCQSDDCDGECDAEWAFFNEKHALAVWMRERGYDFDF